MSKKLSFFEDFMLSGVAAGVSKVSIIIINSNFKISEKSNRNKILV